MIFDIAVADCCKDKKGRVIKINFKTKNFQFTNFKICSLYYCASTAIGAYIASVLGLATAPATITGAIVGVAVGFGWDWMKSIDRSRMYNSFSSMGKTQYLKVQFMWASNMVNKFYTAIAKGSYAPNPFLGTFGDWYGNKYGYLYKL